MKKINILIFAYYSFKDPVFQSAVLPYFIDFPEKENFRFILLTWEQKAHQIDSEEVEKIRFELASHNINWISTSWHSGRFKIFKKVFDLIFGIVFSTFLILKYRIEIVYSEGFPGAVIGHYLSKFNRKKHVVHTFEPHTDYMIESGVWSETSWEAVWLKRLEKRVAKRCSLIMTATKAYIEKIQSWDISSDRLIRAPSCVDTELFKFNKISRNEIREKHGISEEHVVITYLGKLGGMYMKEEMFEFFKQCEECDGNRFRYFILTGDDPKPINDIIRDAGISIDKFVIKKLQRHEVPKYLSASEFGFCGIRPIPSRRYSSPIKDGEYWACGLPIIIPRGISDDYQYTKERDLGFEMESVDNENFRNAAKRILESNGSFNRSAIRSFAVEDRSVKTFQKTLKQQFEVLL